MNPKPLVIAAAVSLLGALGAFLIWGPSGSGRDSSQIGPASAPAAFIDAARAPWQGDLLEVAFAAASAFPSDPHIKNRSRAQEEVVVACLDLGLPGRARACLDRMETWRQGVGFADLADWCARNGQTAHVPDLLRRAQAIADESARHEDFQDWHRDRILSRIARTLVFTGRPEEAAKLASAVVASETGPLDQEKARHLDPTDFDSQIRAIDEAIAIGNFEISRNSLEVCAVLYDRFYDDFRRKSALESRVKTSAPNLPGQVRAGLLMQLAGTALDREDRATALTLVNDARTLAGPPSESAEGRIPMMARLAELRYRAGETKEALGDLSTALAMYEGARPTIVDIYRTGVLIPVGEAYHRVGDRQSALGVYRRALEEAVVNPNSRPRADGLVAICCSMAVRGVEPDASLMERIRQVQAGLGHPW